VNPTPKRSREQSDQLELTNAGAGAEVRCPYCSRTLDPEIVRDEIVAALMAKILRLRSRLAEFDPHGPVI
jgi:hypothetical protein